MPSYWISHYVGDIIYQLLPTAISIIFMFSADLDVSQLFSLYILLDEGWLAALHSVYPNKSNLSLYNLNDIQPRKFGRNVHQDVLCDHRRACHGLPFINQNVSSRYGNQQDRRHSPVCDLSIPYICIYSRPSQYQQVFYSHIHVLFSRVLVSIQ